MYIIHQPSHKLFWWLINHLIEQIQDDSIDPLFRGLSLRCPQKFWHIDKTEGTQLQVGWSHAFWRNILGHWRKRTQWNSVPWKFTSETLAGIMFVLSSRVPLSFCFRSHELKLWSWPTIIELFGNRWISINTLIFHLDSCIYDLNVAIIGF